MGPPGDPGPPGPAGAPGSPGQDGPQGLKGRSFSNCLESWFMGCLECAVKQFLCISYLKLFLK